MTPLEIRSRYDYLKSQRRTIETTWDYIERYAAPYRGEFFRDETSEHEIDWNRRFIFDTTAIMAVQNLAAAIHGGMTNPKSQWFNFRFQDEELNQDQQSAVWLEAAARKVWHALQDSNFDLEINEGYLDLTGFGTSVLVEEAANEQVWEGIEFTAIPIKQCFFEPDEKNGLLRLYRKLWWTPLQALHKFGDATPRDVKEKAENPGGIDTREEYIFAIYPREGVPDDVVGPTAPDRRPYAAEFIRHKDATLVGKSGGYYENPAYVTRWRKTSMSQWGNSPAMTCLGDILTLNQLVELDLRSREKVIDPPVLVTERGLVGDLDFNPAGITVVRSLEEIQAWDSGAKFDAVNDTINRLQMQIKEVFFLDKIDLKESPEMTATEVIERTERMHRLLGPTIGRLQADLLDPLVTRTYNMLLRAGQIEQPPSSVEDSNAEMDIEYTGSLARAQKVETAQAVDRMMGSILNMAQVQPDIVDNIDFDKAANIISEALSIPAALMRGMEAVKKIRADRQAEQAKQKQAQEAAMAGEAMQSVGAGVQSLQSIEGGQAA